MGIMMSVMSGYTSARKRHACKIRVFYKNNELKLRIRDDCMAFNIKEKAKKLTQTDPYDVSNYAIRIIMGLAKTVEYVNLLRTNNLIITL